MSITSIVGRAFEGRQKALEAHALEGEALQNRVLSHLISRATPTEYGRRHGFERVKGYEDFARNVPVNT